jgi:TetR/AcrR family transcriptional repressor of nem operon
MGVSKEQAALNRQAILDSAVRLFRARGVDAVGLVELMKEAGFTQGGFYNHFSSKQALATEVVTAALQEAQHRLTSDLEQPLAADEDALTRQLAYYFSESHRDDIAHGCPLAGLSGDVARLGGEAQQRFADGLENTFAAFGALLPPAPKTPQLSARERAIALYSQMVGALVLSRAVSGAAPELSEEILCAAQHDALAKLALQAGRHRRD